MLYVPILFFSFFLQRLPFYWIRISWQRHYDCRGEEPFDFELKKRDYCNFITSWLFPWFGRTHTFVHKTFTRAFLHFQGEYIDLTFGSILSISTMAGELLLLRKCMVLKFEHGRLRVFNWKGEIWRGMRTKNSWKGMKRKG